MPVDACEPERDGLRRFDLDVVPIDLDVVMGHSFGCWWPENTTRGDVVGGAVQGARYGRSLHHTFREWPSPVRTGLIDSALGADIEEGNRAPFQVDCFRRSGRYFVGFRNLD